MNGIMSFLEGYSKVITFLKKHGRVYQDKVFALPAKYTRQLRITPDFVSVLCMFAILLSSILLFMQNHFYLLTLSLAICLDMLDGTLARMYPKRRSGKLFDYFLDRFSDTMILLALMASGMLGYYFTLLLLFFYVLSTLLTKLVGSLKIRIYILSYRILTFAGLLLQEFNPNALLFFSSILLIDYAATALFTLPKIVFRRK